MEGVAHHVVEMVGDDFVLSAKQVESLVAETGMERRTLARLLCLRVALSRSVAPISSYAAGAVVLGTSGAMYIGANMEFKGTTLGESIHAEQFAVSNALLHGERSIAGIVTAPTPCGHCRQFLRECNGAETMEVTCYAKEGEQLLLCQAPLLDLLPFSFGPQDLGSQDALLDDNRLTFDLKEGPLSPVDRQALHMMKRSYASHTRGHGCVALVWKRDNDPTEHVSVGVYLENAAYNPSLPPLQCALIHQRIQGGLPSNITAAIVYETSGSPLQHFPKSCVLLQQLCPALSVTHKLVNATPSI